MTPEQARLGAVAKMSEGSLAQTLWGGLKGPAEAVLVGVAVAAGYYAAAQLAFFIGTLSDQMFAPFWPPNVILFCGLLLSSRDRWGLILAITLPAHILAELSVGMPFGQMMIAFATNCAVAIMNALAVSRFVGGPPWLGTLQKTAAFLVITGVISPAISALGGAFVPIAGGGPLANYWIFWANWFVGNGLAALTLGPLLLGLAEADWRKIGVSLGWREAEAVFYITALLGVSVIGFSASVRIAPSPFVPALLYLPLPVILWGSVRFGPKGAAGATLVLAVVSMWLTLKSVSPFFDESPETSVVALQLFLIGIAVPALLLSAAVGQLRSSERVTRAVAGSILAAQDEERRRIARDIHDSTTQNLVAADMVLGAMKAGLPASAIASVRECSGFVQQSLQELRTLAYVLHPPMLDQGGLCEALPNYLEGFTERSGIAIDLAVAPDIGRLPQETELAFYRVVQEGLSNVHRHSRSSIAKIELTRRKARLAEFAVLTIEDHGIGMSQSENRLVRGPPGVGLDSMRERLRQVGGDLTIDSRPGRTVLTAQVRVPT